MKSEYAYGKLLTWVRWSGVVFPVGSCSQDRAVEAPFDVNVAEVYAQHNEFVFWALRQLGAWGPDVEDLHQRVWLVVIEKLPSFDPSRSIKAWLFRICKNVHDNYRKDFARQCKRIVYDDDVELTSEGVERSAEERLIDEQARLELYEVLDELDEDKRLVLVLYEIEDMPCKAIAELLEIPVGTVHSRLHTARADFEKRLARRRPSSPRGGGR